jgi:isopentenyl-diphosphate delta-isomerase
MPDTIVELQGYDKDQIDMMEENCIVVDDKDSIIGKDTKVNCHLGEGKLHRAFSVLLFNSENKLLIQKRASEKITFPSIWANSCCSHPLYSNNEEEGIIGAQKAAKRKLSQELGIDTSLIGLNDLKYITKMHYRSRADEKWIEHEIDYIFVIKCDVDINPNTNEIEQTKYVDQHELQLLFDASDNNSLKIGPWFRLIKENFLSDIWDALDNPSNIADEELHYMGDCK